MYKDILDILSSSPKFFSFCREKISSGGIFMILIGCIVILIAISVIFSTIGIPAEIFNIKYFKAYVIGLFILIWIVFGIIKRYTLPKNRVDKKGKGKITIVLAIDDKGEFLGFSLKYDFINEIRSNLDSNFQLIILPAKYVENITEEKIKSLNEKIKGHYWIYGKIERQPSKGIDKCFIETKALVVHDADISDIVQHELYTDFNKLYAGDISFAESWYRDGAKFTGKYSAIIAKYIIGVASLISGDPISALKMHKTLHEEFKNIQKENGVDANFDENYAHKIAEKIKVIQYHEYRIICNYFYYKKDLNAWQINLEEWGLLGSFYGFIDSDLLTQRAIYTFIVKRDIVTARQLIKNASKLGSNESYKYSLIFLDIYNKDYKLAKTRMKEILEKKRLYKDEHLSVMEVIGFMDDVMLQESDRFEFLYWQSLLYYKKSENIPMAWRKMNDYIKAKGNKSPLEYEIYQPREIQQELSRKMKIIQ